MGQIGTNSCVQVRHVGRLDHQRLKRRCQTDANSPQFANKRNLAGRAKATHAANAAARFRLKIPSARHSRLNSLCSDRAYQAFAGLELCDCNRRWRSNRREA